MLVLFSVAALVAMVSQRLRLPYTIALVVAGLAIGGLGMFEAPHLTKKILFLVVLPGLLFEAAYHMDFREFWSAKVTIFTLAIPGLVVATGLAGFGVWVGINGTGLGEITFVEALVFGSLISATDPISVLSVFKTLGVNKKLYTLVEGESLFNDGTAVVIFTILLGIATGGEISAADAVVEFVRVAGVATILGAGIGIGVGYLTKAVREPTIEITLTALCAYGAFIVAEHFHFSGVIACVVAGMLTGNWGARVGMTASTRIAVVSFWTYAAFALNSFVFLLVGFQIELAHLWMHVVPIVVAWIAVTGGRAIVVYAKWAFMKMLGKEYAFPLSWATVLTWGGLRGGLSMVLALGLPRNFEHRELILHLTFGVVLISLLVQGLTMKPLLEKLGLVGKSPNRDRYEEKRAELGAAKAALDELDAMHARKAIPTPIHDSLVAEYKARMAQLDNEVKEVQLAKGEIVEAEEEAMRRHLLAVEKDSIRETLHEGRIGQRVFQTLDERLDERSVLLEAHHDS